MFEIRSFLRRKAPKQIQINKHINLVWINNIKAATQILHYTLQIPNIQYRESDNLFDAELLLLMFNREFMQNGIANIRAILITDCVWFIIMNIESMVERGSREREKE